MNASDKLLPVPGANQSGSPTDPAMRLVQMSDGTYAVMVVAVNKDGTAIGGGGGGGGGGSGSSAAGDSVIDAANVIWWMVVDSTNGAVTYYQYGTTTVGTPTLPVKPYEYTAGSVQVTQSSLPTGAATSALQTAGNAALSSIDAKTPALGQALAAQSVPVVLTAAQIEALKPTTGAATDASVQAITTSLGTDGATPPAIAGTGVRGWLRGIFEKLAGTLTVSGTVSVGNFPATQAVSGTVSVGNLPATQAVSAMALPLPAGASTAAKQDAMVNALGTPMQQTGGSVSVSNLPATQAVSAAALPLPAGASTAALQATGNTSLANIDTDIGTTADAAWSGTGNGSVIAALKGIFGKLAGTLAVAIQQLFSYSANNSTNGTSTAFTVATGSSWMGTVEAAINQNFATISVISTQAVTVTVNQYLDALGTIMDVPPVSFTVAAGTPYTFPLAIQGNYFKLSVSNASGASASVTVDTYFGPLPVEPATLTQAGNKKTSIQEQLVTISTVNSSTAQLAASATFTGAWEAVLNTASVQVSVVADQPTTITVQQSQDLAGTKIVSSKQYTRAAGAPFAESLLVVGTYLRITVQNTGASTTTTLSAQTIYTPVMNQSPVGPDNSGNMPVGIGQQVYGSTNGVFVGGTSQVQVTPAVTAASAYVTGNVVGGLLTFANVVQATVLSGVLESVTLAIKSTQTATFKLYLFRSAPSATFTDKTSPAINAADASLLLDVITLSGGDSGLGANATLYVADNIGKSLVLAGTALYGVLVVTGTPTFTTTTDVVVTASILKD
jgi:hypothetical protein